MNALREADFVKVEPKGSFDPYRGPDGTMFFGAHQLTAFSFRKPGPYTIRFVYSTESEKPEQWLGDGRLDSRLTELCEQVSRATLRSNVVRVTILPKGAGAAPIPATRTNGSPQDS